MQINGRAGIPASGVDAVALNVTAVDQTLPTFVTVWPADVSQPSTSNLNPFPGITAPNLVISKVSASGQIQLYNSTGDVNLIADVAGWFAPGGTYTAVTPSRIMDSRSTGLTDDHIAEKVGALGTAQVYGLQVTGRGSVPLNGVGAVAVNITAVNQTAETFITVYPSDSARTNTSNLNPKPGIVAPNMAVVKVGADGRINLFNAEGSTDLIVDVVGWFPVGATFTPLTPARLLDTRAFVGVTIDGIGAGVGAVSPAGVRTIRVAGRGGVPATGVSSVVLNVTAINQTLPSFITAFPAGQTRPNSSNLNPTPGITAPNLVIAKVGPNGDVSLYNSSGSVDLIVDVAAWFSGDPLQSTTLNRIATGLAHTCALTTVGTVRCTGSNEFGQIGLPLIQTASTTFVDVVGVSDVVSIDSGGSTTCAVLGDSTVKCWGQERALGSGGTTNSPTPATVAGLSGVVSVSLDYLQACAVTVGGAVYCWGDNNFGAVGPGTILTSVARSPLRVTGVDNAVQVGVGTYASCATISDGSVKCWGDGNSNPAAVGGLSGVAAISMGTNHRCVLRTNGTAACAGQNGAGQLANSGGTSTAFAAIANVEGAVGIEAGQYHTCVWNAAGVARCWGGNNQGQVGDGTGAYAVADIIADPVAGGLTITEISASNQTCATTSAGSYYCWGFNPNGNLGFASPDSGRQSTPQLIVGA